MSPVRTTGRALRPRGPHGAAARRARTRVAVGVVAWWLAAGALVVGCASGPGGEPPDVQFPGPNDCTPLSATVTFSEVYARVLSPVHCGAAGSCHSRGADSEAGLDLSTEEAARAGLLNNFAATAGFCTPEDVVDRVAPGDPERSMLWRRVTGRTCAERMPPVGPRLTCDELVLLRQWIAEGAP